MTHVAECTHANELEKNASVGERFFTQKQDDGHDGSGNDEAQEEDSEDVHAVCISVASEDGDEQDASEAFHFVFQFVEKFLVL